jgi:hypothetical protein
VPQYRKATSAYGPRVATWRTPKTGRSRPREEDGALGGFTKPPHLRCATPRASLGSQRAQLLHLIATRVQELSLADAERCTQISATTTIQATLDFTLESEWR